MTIQMSACKSDTRTHSTCPCVSRSTTNSPTDSADRNAIDLCALRERQHRRRRTGTMDMVDSSVFCARSSHYFSSDSGPIEIAMAIRGRHLIVHLYLRCDFSNRRIHSWSPSCICHLRAMRCDYLCGHLSNRLNNHQIYSSHVRSV